MARIWHWRHRTWPEAEQILMQRKFAEFHDAKRIRSISLLSFSRKKKNWSSFEKIGRVLQEQTRDPISDLSIF